MPSFPGRIGNIKRLIGRSRVASENSRGTATRVAASGKGARLASPEGDEREPCEYPNPQPVIRSVSAFRDRIAHLHVSLETFVVGPSV